MLDNTTPVTFCRISCYECGIEYAVPQKWHQTRLRDGWTTYCPNGHKWSYIINPEDRDITDVLEECEELRAKLARLTHDHEQLGAKLRDLEEVNIDELTAVDEQNRFTCPHCGKKYSAKMRSPFATHLEYNHNDRTAADIVRNWQGVINAAA